VYPPLNRDEIRGEFGEYQKEYDRSIASLGDFWMDASKNLTWFEEPKISISQRDNDNPYFYDWFPDGTINTSYNCLDVHVKNGRGDQIALIYDSPLTSAKEQYTYKELLDKVSTFAGALKNDLGIQKGDRVVLYLPLIPQAAIAMLACARIGAVHSVVFGGFAANELASRITDCKPKVIITASCGVEPTRIVEYRPILDDALKLTNHKVDKVVIVQRSDVKRCDLRPIDVDYDDLMSTASAVDATPLPATHPHYILYTSGTTG
jgi:propionyl-CoA synthetase